MDLLWPELGTEAAGANLRKAIHHARRGYYHAGRRREAVRQFEHLRNALRECTGVGLV